MQTPPKPTAEIVCVDEVLKVPSELVVTVVVEALDGCVLDGPVHSLDPLAGKRLLAIAEKLPVVRPRMVDLGEPVLDAVVVADPIEDVMERIFVAGLVGELDAPGSGPGQAIVGEYRVDRVGHRRDQIAQELGRDHLACLLMQFDISELGCPIPLGDCPAITCRAVDGDEQAQLSLGRLNLGDVDPRITSEDKHGSSRPSAMLCIACLPVDRIALDTCS